MNVECPRLWTRDWIEGVPGKTFREHVQKYTEQIEATLEAATANGVLIAEPDPIDFVAAFFAAVHSGVPVILANPKWQRSEWEQLGKQVSPAIVLGAPAIFKPAASETKGPGPGTILIPTGGSSGELKLAIHTWDTLTAACEGFRSFAGPGAIHSCCVLPLYHVSGLMQVMRSFTSGGRIVFTDYKMLQLGEFPELEAENLCLSLVPTQLQRMIEQKIVVDWLSRLKAIFLGGAPLSASLRSRACEMRLPIVPSYGMTETAAMVTALPAKDCLSGNTSVGKPLSPVAIQVIDAEGFPCSPGERGRIRIQTASLCLGYHGRPLDFSNEGYLSTDEGYLDSDGCLHIVGRSNRIINSGGEKIDPLEVEEAFLNTGMVQQVLVMGWPDPEWGERLVAFYVPVSRAEGAEPLRQRLKAQLVNYKLPGEIIQVSELPLTPQGKPDRSLIAKLLQGVA